jgi:ATP-dependent Zn protease
VSWISKIVALHFLFWVLLFLSFILLWAVVQQNASSAKVEEIPYSDLLGKVQNGQVRDAEIQGNEIYGHLRDSAYDEFHAVLPPSHEELLQALIAAHVKVTAGGPRSKRLSPELLLIGVASCAALLLAVIVTLPFWVIFKKAGFQPILSVLTLIPLLNVVLLYYVAFSEWKAAPPQKS